MQHREVQGYESSLFSSYFAAGIRYLDGGVASGFKKISDDVYEKKLLQIKGKRNVRVVQVITCQVTSINIDLIKTWAYAGPDANILHE